MHRAKVNFNLTTNTIYKINLKRVEPEMRSPFKAQQWPLDIPTQKRLTKLKD